MKYLFLFFIFFISACATTPEDQGISEKEVNEMSLKAYQEVKTKSKISNHREWNLLVRRVAQRIAQASGKNYQWEVILIENKEPNAWCMPGGKMAVYTGILPILKTEGALAAVMGHEVAHATLQHGMQRYARAKQDNQRSLLIGLGTIIGGELLCKDEACRQLAQVGGLAAGFAMAFFDRKFSREEESSADKTGQLYMAKAGYDPIEAARVWERMSAANGGKGPPEFLSTHPSDENRKANLSSWLQEAQSEYQRANIKYGVGEEIK